MYHQHQDYKRNQSLGLSSTGVVIVFQYDDIGGSALVTYRIHPSSPRWGTSFLSTWPLPSRCQFSFPSEYFSRSLRTTSIGPRGKVHIFESLERAHFLSTLPLDTRANHRQLTWRCKCVEYASSKVKGEGRGVSPRTS